MSKQLRTIQNSQGPVTQATLLADLRALGVQAGDILLVHSSLTAIGWVAGGPQAVVSALMEAVSASGTVVMPAHSSFNTEPSHWQNPPVPEEWWPTIRAQMPAFDKDTTPTLGMGAIVECFRTLPQAVRSVHPALSFVASGPAALEITGNHSLNDGLGNGSPLARLEELGAKVLLLGVGFSSCTLLHLAEARADFPCKGVVRQGGSLRLDGENTWVTYSEQNYNSDDFSACGDEFLKQSPLITGRIGQARSHLFKARDLLAFAIPWFTRQRSQADWESALRFQPLLPEELKSLLKGFSDWGLAGGWSLDWLMNSSLRSHNDTDIAVLRRDIPACLEALSHFHVYLCVGDSELHLWDGSAIACEVHSLWIKRGNTPVLQILVFDEINGMVSYRRDLRIGWPVDSMFVECRGLRLLNPMITVLFKLHGRSIGSKDCVDVSALIKFFSEKRY